MNQKTLLELLTDTRTCLIWLRILEDEFYYKERITDEIKRLDKYIELEIKEDLN